MKIKSIYVLFCFLLSTFLFVGCKGEEIYPPYQPNYDIAYVRYDYCLMLHWFDGDKDGVQIQNATQTGKAVHEGASKGWRIVQNKQGLSEILSRAEDLFKTAMQENPKENAYRENLLSETLRTTDNLIFDDHFFQENNLLLIDICYYEALHIDILPHTLETIGTLVSIDLLYGYDYACTGGNSGAICLIPIPKECTEASVNFICVPTWTKDNG